MKYKLIVIGTSLGGLQALETILPKLPKNFSVPIVVVQHRHKDSDDTLRTLLQQHCSLIIKEVQDKEKIVPGCVYLAPANYHSLIESQDLSSSHPCFALSTDAPVIYSRPSINVLFETAADAYGKQLMGVLLTGANHDGTEGLAKIKARGGTTVVEEPSSAVCPIMPMAAIALGVVDKILPLVDIAPFLVSTCQSVKA